MKNRQVPSFPQMGSRRSLRQWLSDKIPAEGGTYFEPFAGKGNAFYWMRQHHRFAKWILSDLDTAFLEALMKLEDVERIPRDVTRSDYQLWKLAASNVSRVIEPAITFGGKGYSFGFFNHEGADPRRFKGLVYREIVREARRLLKGVEVRRQDWEAVNWDYYGPDDFVYLDPPYLGIRAKTSMPYRNIDHGALCDMLSCAPFRWALSGYDSALYAERLSFSHRLTLDYNSQIRTAQAGSRVGTTEVLWLNYDPPTGV